MSEHDSVLARYQRDASFATLVNMVRSVLDRCEFSPTEVREAVMLGCQLHELYNVRPVRFHLDRETWEALKREREHREALGKDGGK